MVQDVIVCSHSFLKLLTNVYTKDIMSLYVVQFPSQFQNHGMHYNKTNHTLMYKTQRYTLHSILWAERPLRAPASLMQHHSGTWSREKPTGTSRDTSYTSIPQPARRRPSYMCGLELEGTEKKIEIDYDVLLEKGVRRTKLKDGQPLCCYFSVTKILLEFLIFWE